MTLAREIYTKAETTARKEHARLVRRFIAGKLDVCPCGMDMERDAIITAFDDALAKQGNNGRLCDLDFDSSNSSSDVHSSDLPARRWQRIAT